MIARASRAVKVENESVIRPDKPRDQSFLQSPTTCNSHPSLPFNRHIAV